MISSNLARKVVSAYIDTSSKGPGTIQPPPLPDPGPLDPRRVAAIDSLLGPKASDEIRKRMQTVLQPMPTGELEALKRFGLKINITVPTDGIKGKLVQAGLQRGVLGGYVGLLRQIYFAKAVLDSDHGPHTVIHELCHAIDDMRDSRKSIMAKIPGLKTVRGFMRGMESSKDREMRTLYHQYQARANVEDIDVMRREVKLKYNDLKLRERDMVLPEKGTITSDFDHWGVRPVKYERKNGQEIFTIEPTVKEKNMRIARVAVGAAILAGGMGLPHFFGPAAVTVGGILLGMSAYGYAKAGLHKLTAPKTVVEVDMATKGAKAHVVQQDERAVVTVPDGARSFSGETWSDYAHRGNMGEEQRGVGEYTAEAYSTYLEGGDKAQLFLDNDPNMYHFVENRMRDEFNRNP